MPSRKRKQQLATARAARSACRPSSEDHNNVLSSASDTSTPLLNATLPLTSLIPTRESASKRKLHFFSSAAPTPGSSFVDIAFVYLNMFQGLFSTLLCPFCFNDGLQLSASDKSTSSLARKIEVRCPHCDKVISSTFSSPRMDDNSYDINSRVTAASVASGIGYETLNKFLEFMNMSSLHHKTFSSHISKIHRKLPSFINRVLSLACDKVREVYNYNVPGSDIVDVDVSYDGTWQTRGHKSQSGVSCVIEAKTGLVTDFHVMTRFCQLCATIGEKLKGTADYDSWFSLHAKDCHKNHIGSAGSMEQKGAVEMWGRSEERNKMRYISVISDGDSNTIKELHKLNPYGSSCPVKKLECVNHVSKRMGKALRTLVDTKKKQKISLGGNGLGKLTEKKMVKLQTYFRKAIMSSETVEGIRKAIWATYYHSTDIHHFDCPPGAYSYCHFRRAIAKGTTPLEKYSTTYLNPFVAKYVKEVYVKLTDSDLLERCLSGKTQNANESIHSLIWSRCPKHLFVHKPRLDIAVSLGVAEFNMGSTGSHLFLEELGFGVGSKTLERGSKRDSCRIRKAERAVTEDAKRRRIIVKNALQAEMKRVETLEGGPQYDAGAF